MIALSIRDLFSAALPDHPSRTPLTIKLGATLCVTTAPAATTSLPENDPGQNDRRGTNKDIVVDRHIRHSVRLHDPSPRLRWLV